MEQLSENNIYARNIYLIGTAEGGPVNYPILAKSLPHVKSVFGETGSLVDGYSILLDTDIYCNIWLVKTSGGHAEAYLNILKEDGEILENGFYIKSKHANDISNSIDIYLDDNVLTFTYPAKLGGNTLSYSLAKYETLHDLASAINQDTKLGKGEVFCSAYCEPHTSCKFSLAPVNATRIKLVGGNSGLHYNKNMLYNSMEVTYSVLEGRPTDIVVPLEMYYNDTLTNDLELLDKLDFNKDYITLRSNGEYLSFYNQLLDFCKLQMQSSILTHGVMGLEPIRELGVDEDKLIEQLEVYNKINELPSTYSNYNHMVSVIASDMYAIYGTIVVNAYLAYAALLASTKISETTTNKKVPKSFILYNVLTQDTLGKISDLGYVCFRNSPLTKCIHVVNGVTKSSHTELKYVCNVRMMQVVMKNIKYTLSKYIGQNIDDLIESGKLNEEMANLMISFRNEGFIKDFSTLALTKKDNGQLLLMLSFATAYMVEEIKAYSGLSSLGDIKNGLQ